MNPTHRAYIGIGSNVEHSRENVAEAIGWLAAMDGTALSVFSHIYRTPAVNGAAGIYSNAVCRLDTPLLAEQLESLLKTYEIDHGRDHLSRLAKIVPIDLDIVIFDGQQLRPHELQCDYFTIGYREIVANQIENQ